MSAPTCPHCGANLEAPQSVRIAEYHFGHLTQETSASGGPVYVREQPDVYTILCSTCKRLVRTLPMTGGGKL